MLKVKEWNQESKKIAHKMAESFCKSGKRSASRIYKELLQVNDKKTNSPVKNRAKDLNISPKVVNK